jgi:hypothetical protein
MLMEMFERTKHHNVDENGRLVRNFTLSGPQQFAVEFVTSEDNTAFLYNNNHTSVAENIPRWFRRQSGSEIFGKGLS